jgi:hypothetical protein
VECLKIINLYLNSAGEESFAQMPDEEMGFLILTPPVEDAACGEVYPASSGG